MNADVQQPRCALTIDVEDWIQSVHDPDAPLTDCFIHNTHAVLDLLARHGVRATFFVLGLAAEKSPSLIQSIATAGHEIQSHGHGHRLIHTQFPAQFREDLRRSKHSLEDLIGRNVTGYRAPAFSVTRRTLWALDEIAAAGFDHDSSIFPLHMRRYGINGLPKAPYRIRTRSGREILEIPVCTWRFGPLVLPAGGGGYLRVAPLGYTRAAIARTLSEGRPAVLYMHPYELAPDEFDSLPPSIPWLRRQTQRVGRSSFADRLSRLLREFPMTTLADVRRRVPQDAPVWSLAGGEQFAESVAAPLLSA